MNREICMQRKSSFIELWRHYIVMQHGWRMGIVIAIALFLLAGCTPVW